MMLKSLEISISNSLFSNLKENYEIRPFNILSENSLNGGWRSLMKVGIKLKNTVKRQQSSPVTLVTSDTKNPHFAKISI